MSLRETLFLTLVSVGVGYVLSLLLRERPVFFLIAVFVLATLACALVVKWRSGLRQ